MVGVELWEPQGHCLVFQKKPTVSELVNKQAQNNHLVGTLTLDLPRLQAVGLKAQAMVSRSASAALVKCPYLGDEGFVTKATLRRLWNPCPRVPSQHHHEMGRAESIWAWSQLPL